MIRRVRSGWQGTILVCGKCSKKVGGGFGPKGTLSLAKALRKDVGLGQGRKASGGVVEVKCLGICPKRAVTVIDAAKPGEWLVVPAGTSVGRVALELGLVGPHAANQA